MKKNMLSLGVIAHSRKENELRLRIHPEHFQRIPDPLRRSIRFEAGYGARFGIADAVLADLFGGVASRAELMATSDVVLLPKPQMADLKELRRGGTLWGWPHCVQSPGITQAANAAPFVQRAGSASHLPAHPGGTRTWSALTAPAPIRPA